MIALWVNNPPSAAGHGRTFDALNKAHTVAVLNIRWFLTTLLNLPFCGAMITATVWCGSFILAMDIRGTLS